MSSSFRIQQAPEPTTLNNSLFWKKSEMSFHQNHQTHSNLFQVPQTPSASSSQCYSMPLGSDNRPSISLLQDRERFADFKSFRGSPTSSPESSMTSSSDVISPPPLVNLKYDLAGGLETPSGKYGLMTEEDAESNQYDISFRRGRGNAGLFADPYKASMGEYFPPLPSALAQEGNGRKRTHSEIEDSSGGSWGSFVFNIVGGVAGRLWDLCARTNPFRGFHSGVASGHSITRPRQGSMSMGGSWYYVHDTDMQDAGSSSPQPLPQTKSLQYEPHRNHQQSNTTERPSKRQQTRKATENNLSASWVMVSSSNKEPSSSYASIATPSRKPALQTVDSRARRPSLAKLSSNSSCRPLFPARRPSFVSQASAPASMSASSASVASPRSYDISHTAGPARSTRSTSGTSASKHANKHFLPETQRYAAKRRKQERELNTSFRNMNRQLRSMITEGKEALASFP
ncbi:hypothetical protein L228DRAFT_244318 [Xylona heveae TC161]|uniref:Uncharacterized protein n=1 Tax=Xylona heveae (strain CBS 132557 / TC161) TaxID=1328760 RepID=A0A165IWE7_XYLHT|nr:hypothetical protein L228DRAFT_244318 [Xylona heveae TC161]KZF25473.1 hypothetical protein L228DRAFT_244318 [Xylona heveae TC161]